MQPHFAAWRQIANIHYELFEGFAPFYNLDDFIH